jgi:hypothetical protein
MASAEVLWRFDASTTWGMGAFMWDTSSTTGFYILHPWSETERAACFVDVVSRESTAKLEGMAAVRCAWAFSRRCKGKRVLMEGDSEALAQGLRKCYSSTPAMMGYIHQVWEEATKFHICLRPTHIIGTCTTRSRTLTQCRARAHSSPCGRWVAHARTYAPWDEHPLTRALCV